MVRAFWRDHGSFGACCKCPLNYNICVLLYSDRGYTQYQRQVNIFLSFPQCRQTASPMCSNSACESHNKLLLYLLNNKGLSYLISANTVSVLRTQCEITSRTLHVELLKPFRRQYVTYQVTYRIIITLEGSNSTFIKR